ncbi:ATP-binding protein [Embleya sp. NPDC008237]|uniref:ATP-binding protein n=1 Tax=Embleya sp. NPDC008237 TaxID=3363978 RepID=UPI0036F07D03
MAAVKSVEFDRELHELILASGQSRRGVNANNFFVHSDDLKGMRPTDLKAALKQAMEGDDVEVRVTHDDNVDEDYSIAEPISFTFSAGQLSISVSVGYHPDGRDIDEAAIAAHRAVLTPYLKRRRASVSNVELVDCVPQGVIWNIEIACSPRGRDMADLFQIGEGAMALLQAFQSGELTRETTLDLIRSGNAQVLVGQEEGPWLDVKSAHYDLQSPSGKINIARAVARFANAEHGGIVVVGMRGKKIPGGEIISSICPVPVDRRTLRNYKTALEQHLYPPPDYLDIEMVPAEGGGLIVLHIPPQPEEHKPFLVHGAIVEGKVEGTFISIVRRRGETSISITAPAVHATLAAGRALLRRGELPKDSG